MFDGVVNVGIALIIGVNTIGNVVTIGVVVIGMSGVEVE